jgi:DNA-binding NarL/FixJ family response regulator
MKFLVIDDHPLIGEALRQVVGRLDASAQVLEAARCEAGLEIAERNPDLALVVLDMRMPGLSGVPALRAWRRAFPAVPVVVVSASEDRSAILAALEGGAAGFIPKSSPARVIENALRLVMAGGRYVPPEVLAQAGAPDSPRKAASLEHLGLTDRQLQVLRLIVRGKPNKLIGRELGLAERTVKAHVSAVFRALNVESRTQAVIAAAGLGLDSAGEETGG